MDVSDIEKCSTDAVKLEKWLELTSSRCNSLKSYMTYMKMCLSDRPPNADCRNVKIYNNDEQINCNDFMNDLCDIPSLSAVTDNDNDDKLELHYYSNAENISPPIKERYKKEKKGENLNASKEVPAELTILTPRTYSIPESAHVRSGSLSPIRTEDMQRNEGNCDWQSSYKKHLTEYTTDLMENIKNPRKSFEKLILNNESECLLQGLSSARDDIKLNISSSVKNGPVSKCKIRVKADRKDKTSRKSSLSKLDEINSLKHKRRKGKLHYTNSKSTVATRDTSFLGRKESKKRKSKNNTSNRQQCKPQQSCNDVVEIYHNAAAKNDSTSGIANKCLKPNRVNNTNKLSPCRTKQPNLSAKSKCEENSYQHSNDDNESNWRVEPQGRDQSKVEQEATRVYSQSCNLNASPVYAMQKCNSHQCQRIVVQETYRDPMITRNYEMPTLASKLKRANRSYFSRFNFRNIPFVVGTSVSPSHNLGLNIQQVLSIMKTRQPATNGSTPLLIRKVSKGMNPVNIIMEQMDNQYSKLREMNSQISNTLTRREHSCISGLDTASTKSARKGLNDSCLNFKSTVKECRVVRETPRKNSDNDQLLCKRVCSKEKQDAKSEHELDKCIKTPTSKSTSSAKILKLFTPQQNVQAEMRMSNLQSKIDRDNVHSERICEVQSDYSENLKGIREVLVNLHDQFEKMNTKYEKLQEGAEKCKNKEPDEEMVKLEKELNAKEEEINAVVGLYKEVMVLKHQMKQLQERNSYVCISSEVPAQSRRGYYSAMPFALTKSHGIGLDQKHHPKRGHSFITREPSTSLRLAGLLRQIQTFQKQLRSTP